MSSLVQGLSFSSWKLAAPGAALGSFLQESPGLGPQNPRRKTCLPQEWLSLRLLFTLPATASRGSLCPGKGKHWRSVPEVSLAAHQREFHLKVVLLEPRELQLCGELWCRHPATQHAEFGFFSTSAPQCKSQSAPGSLTHGCALSSHRTLT